MSGEQIEPAKIRDPQKLNEFRRGIHDSLLNIAAQAKPFIQSNGINYNDGFSGVSVEELLDLGQDILFAPTFVDAYGLLASKPSGLDIPYYDLLVGRPELLPMYQAVDLAMRVHEPNRVARGLDIATGTGMGAKILSQYVDHVVATDLAAPFVDIAQKNLGRLVGTDHRKYAKTAEVRAMDALHPVFAPGEMFDVVISIGLSNFLTLEERTQFYTGVHEILKPGGRYYEPQMVSQHVSGNSPRGLLAVTVGGIPAKLNQERLAGRTTSGFPQWNALGFRKEDVQPVIPDVGVMKLVKDAV